MGGFFWHQHPTIRDHRRVSAGQLGNFWRRIKSWCGLHGGGRLGVFDTLKHGGDSVDSLNLRHLHHAMIASYYEWLRVLKHGGSAQLGRHVSPYSCSRPVFITEQVFDRRRCHVKQVFIRHRHRRWRCCIKRLTTPPRPVSTFSSLIIFRPNERYFARVFPV
ncbi:hypothetical protein ENKOMM257B_25915 [Enterobacter kobei]